MVICFNFKDYLKWKGIVQHHIQCSSNLKYMQNTVKYCLKWKKMKKKTKLEAS